jgi:hypothetical protein
MLTPGTSSARVSKVEQQKAEWKTKFGADVAALLLTSAIGTDAAEG